MPARPWYPFYPTDFAGKTRRLSLVERGAYRDLLDEYYASGGPIPADPTTLYRIVGATSLEERRAVDYVAFQAGFFTREGDMLRNSRADSELAKIDEVCTSLSARGKAGAAARWRSKPTKKDLHEEFAQAMPEPMQRPLADECERQWPANAHPHTHPTATPKPPAGKPSDVGPRRPKTAGAPTSAQTWIAYANAFLQRYGVDPPRNARASSLATQLVKLLGADEAPLTAAFYLTLEKSPYLAASHPLTLLVRDAESISTSRKNGKFLTQTEARARDQTAAQKNAFLPLLAEAIENEQTDHSHDPPDHQTP